MRVLLLTSQYFLVNEIIEALNRQGIQYRRIQAKQDRTGSSEFMQELIGTILAFKPDFLITINHMGFDAEGVLTQFLEGIEMPFASWYVDNPNLIIKQYRRNASPYCAMFLWDKNNLEDMAAAGFEHTFYLPLGVDQNRFRPIQVIPGRLSHLANPVTFVGNSMVEKVKESLRKSNVNGLLRSSFDELAFDYMQSEERHIEAVINKSFPMLYPSFQKLNDSDINHYKAAITWEASRLYRLERVKALLPFSPLIVGDSRWAELLPANSFKHLPGLSYYHELPYLYNQATINFNATSRQMKGAPNQRVFDVPACNRFLLTDYQEQMAELFHIGKEIICYREIGEIGELVKYFLAHDTERQQIAGRGYERVTKDHTYESRITQMVAIMKKLYGHRL